MSELFMKGLEKQSNLTETENGAVALKSTNNDLVDLFGSIGGMRNEDNDRVISKFSKAFNEDELLAMKILFYNRDVRNGGLGERKTSRTIYRFLANFHPDVLRSNLKNIPQFGRWDDVLCLLNVGYKYEGDILKMIDEQLMSDVIDEYPSLLAKWLPSINASSPKTREMGQYVSKKLGLTEKQYRQLLSKLRKKIKIVEVMMSSKNFSEIEYSSVPSRAMNIYRNAFYKNDLVRFESYIESLKKGETKINSSTLYPYDIVGKILNVSWGGFRCSYDEILEQQWKSLPNYVEGENNVLIMADTSGSMSGRPMETSLGLAVYFAERNKGYYQNKFMTFSSRPEFVTLKGKSLAEKIGNIKSIVENTNLEAAFNLILKSAIDNNIHQEDMPKSLVVISDMQFDGCHYYNGSQTTNTWHDKMNSMFVEAGYEMPNIVYWNVANRRDSYQVGCEHKGVQLVSGQSASVFKSLLANIGKTPYQAMLDTLNNPIYDCIVV